MSTFCGHFKYARAYMRIGRYAPGVLRKKLMTFQINENSWQGGYSYLNVLCHMTAKSIENKVMYVLGKEDFNSWSCKFWLISRKMKSSPAEVK